LSLLSDENLECWGRACGASWRMQHPSPCGLCDFPYTIHSARRKEPVLRRWLAKGAWRSRPRERWGVSECARSVELRTRILSLDPIAASSVRGRPVVLLTSEVDL